MAHDYVGRLDFSFTELPKWRKDEEERTSKLLSDIVDFFKRYEKLPQVAKKFCTTGFAQLMTVKFVFNVNVGESVGTQTESGTQAVLEDYIERRITKQASNGSKQEAVLKANDRLVTINVYEALKQFFELQKEMSNTGKLTVQQICEIHKVLMNGLREDAGEIRKGFAYVSWNGEDHVYPEPTVAEQLFYASIDHHCKHMTQYHKKLVEETPNVESFGYLFKCAARLLFDFVDAHPFGDGNGRMCRLLANYVLSRVTPFPVSPYSSGAEGRSGREDYLEAIVECRSHRDKGPGTLAAMLIEGTWRGWKSLFDNLEKNNFLTSTISIGPVVVGKSDGIQLRNAKILDAFKRFNVEDESHTSMLELVDRAIEEVCDASENIASRKTVRLPKNVDLYLHIYK